MVTGGAGSLGQAVVKDLLAAEPLVEAVRVFDADEYGLFILKRDLDDDRIRFLLGDIRDRDRMQLALEGIDTVVHVAAVKNLEVTEYNVPEAIRVNVLGTVNLVEAAMLSQAERFLFVSSDKAVNSPTLYGSTKFMGERVILWASRVSGKKFSCCRLANIRKTRGNVFEMWERQAMSGKPLTITSTEMKRYLMETDEAAKFVTKSLDLMDGGEIFIPKVREHSIFKLMRTLHPKASWKETGLRAGEKMREELMTAEEAKTAEEREDMWVIRGR